MIWSGVSFPWAARMPEKSGIWDCRGHTAHGWKGPLRLSFWDAGGHFWRQPLHNLRQLCLSTFCFVQSQHRPGTPLSNSTEDGLPGEGKYRCRCSSHSPGQARRHLPWMQRQPVCGLPAQILLEATVLLCCLGRADQAFFSPACACTQGTRRRLFKGTRHL